MKRSTLLQAALLTVASVIIFFSRITGTDFHSGSAPLPEPGSGCNFGSITGYAPAVPITAADAQRCAQAFLEMPSGGNAAIYGGLMSKATLDSLFCQSNYNGMAYRFGMDPEGRIAPTNAVFVILGAVSVQLDSRGQPSITSQSNKFFVPGSWCPTNCLNF